MKDISPEKINMPKELNDETVIPVIRNLNTFFNQNDSKIIYIDFNETEFVFPGGLTPLLAYLIERKNIPDDYEINLIASPNLNVDLYIRRMGFYSLLGLSDNYPYGKSSGKGKFQELYSFKRDTDINEVSSKTANIIAIFIKNRKLMNYNYAIGWCINEIIDNARNHANSDVNVVFAQKYEGGITKVCVSDRGVGIRETMGESTIESALRKCITRAKGVKSEGMGKGLFNTAELIKNDTSGKCSMSIWSEDAILKIKSGEDAKISKVSGFWQGVNISISMYNNISSDLTVLNDGNMAFSYNEMPEYYEQLFED